MSLKFCVLFFVFIFIKVIFVSGVFPFSRLANGATFMWSKWYVDFIVLCSFAYRWKRVSVRWHGLAWLVYHFLICLPHPPFVITFNSTHLEILKWQHSTIYNVRIQFMHRKCVIEVCWFFLCHHVYQFCGAQKWIIFLCMNGSCWWILYLQNVTYHQNHFQLPYYEMHTQSSFQLIYIYIWYMPIEQMAHIPYTLHWIITSRFSFAVLKFITSYTHEARLYKRCKQSTRAHFANEQRKPKTVHTHTQEKELKTF